MPLPSHEIQHRGGIKAQHDYDAFLRRAPPDARCRSRAASTSAANSSLIGFFAVFFRIAFMSKAGGNNRLIAELNDSLGSIRSVNN